MHVNVLPRYATCFKRSHFFLSFCSFDAFDSGCFEMFSGSTRSWLSDWILTLPYSTSHRRERRPKPLPDPAYMAWIVGRGAGWASDHGRAVETWRGERYATAYTIGRGAGGGMNGWSRPCEALLFFVASRVMRDWLIRRWRFRKQHPLAGQRCPFFALIPVLTQWQIWGDLQFWVLACALQKSTRVLLRAD